LAGPGVAADYTPVPTEDTFTVGAYLLKACANSDNTKLVFACPEYAYQQDDIENILQG